MGKSFLSLFIFVLFTVVTCIAQQREIDSLKQLLIAQPADYKIQQSALFDLSYYYWIYHHDSSEVAASYARKSLAIARENENPTWEIASLNQLARVKRTQEDLDHALALYDTATQIALSTNDSVRLAKIADNRASILVDLGHVEEGIASNKQSFEIFKAINDSTSMAIAKNGLAYIFINRKEYKKALPLLREAIQLAPNWKLAHSEWYGNMAIIYRELNQPDSGLFYFQKAITLAETVPDVQALHFHEQSLLYAKQKDYKNALQAVRQAIAILGNLVIDENYHFYRLQESRYLLELGRTQEAKRIFESAEPYIADNPQPVFQQQLGGIGESLYSKLNAYEKALTFYKINVAARDSLTNVETNARIREIEVQYETAENEATIAQLELDEAKTSTRLKQTRTIAIALLAGLLGVSFLLYRIRKQNKKIAEQRDALNVANQEKDLLLREIHHRVKNNLQTISSLLSLQSRQMDDEKAKIAINEGRSRVRSMALIHQNLYQKDALTSINTKVYFDNLLNEISESYNVREGIALSSDIANIELDVDTMIPLGLIVNELVTNSLKHAFNEEENGEIHIKLSIQDERIYLHVSDNGHGPISANEGRRGFGLRMIQAFVEKLGGTLRQQHDEGFSTDISFDKLDQAA